MLFISRLLDLAKINRHRVECRHVKNAPRYVKQSTTETSKTDSDKQSTKTMSRFVRLRLQTTGVYSLQRRNKSSMLGEMNESAKTTIDLPFCQHQQCPSVQITPRYVELQGAEASETHSSNQQMVLHSVRRRQTTGFYDLRRSKLIVQRETSETTKPTSDPQPLHQGQHNPCALRRRNLLMQTLLTPPLKIPQKVLFFTSISDRKTPISHGVHRLMP
jgi:hypothetical protein